MASRKRASRSKPALVVAHDAVVYRGPLDLAADTDAIEVEFRLPRASTAGALLARVLDAGDPHGANELVRSTPLPLAVIDLLARACVAAQRDACEPLAAGESAPDVRWMRALSRAFGGGSPASGDSDAPRARAIVSLAERQRVMAVRHDGDRLATLSYTLEYGQGTIDARLDFVQGDQRRGTHTFSTLNAVQRALPRPAAAPSDALWLSLRDPSGAVELERWSFDGVRVETRSLIAESAVQRVSLVAEQCWLHCDQHHVRTDARGERESHPHSDPSREPMIVGEALLAFAPRVFDGERRAWLSRAARWLALDGTRETSSLDLSMPVHRVSVTSGGVWLATEDGLFFASPFAPLRCIDGSGPCFAIAAQDERVAYVVGATLTVIDARTHALERSIALPLERGRTMYSATMSAGCIVLNDFTRALVIDPRGAVQWDSGDRREPAAVTLANGTTVVSAGELVSAFGADGARIATNAMPYDGQLLGATREFAIFGPVSGGVARTEPDALYAIDARARVVDALRKRETGTVARPTRTRYGGGTESDQGLVTDDRVLVVDAKGSLLAWRPRSATRRVFAESPRRPSEKGAVETRYHTSNPRDDWPEPAIDLNAVSFYAEDCTWRGTTGVSPERAVVLRNGAVATLVRCKIRGEGGGARVTQGSTLILCDCEFDASAIEREPGSHVLVLSVADN